MSSVWWRVVPLAGCPASSECFVVDPLVIMGLVGGTPHQTHDHLPRKGASRAASHYGEADAREWLPRIGLPVCCRNRQRIAARRCRSRFLEDVKNRQPLAHEPGDDLVDALGAVENG